MRALTYAAIVGVGMSIAGLAVAGPWNDPAGRVSFNTPSGWVTEVRRANPQTIVVTGNANNECYVLTAQNPGTAAAPPNRIHALTEPMTASDWQTLANSVAPMFPQHNASVTNQSVDTSSFWPLQRASLGGAVRPVLAALSHRPGGLDLIAMCWTYGGPDATATYESFFRSLNNSNDATWRAAAEQQDAAHTAAQQAAEQAAQQHQQQQAQQQAQQGQQGQRNNRLDRHGEGPALTPPH